MCGAKIGGNENRFFMETDMKKIIKFLVMAALAVCSAAGFAAEKKSIVCTAFSQYDWVMNVLGDRAADFDVVYLQDRGADLHSYQPSVQDMAKIYESDLFVYVGGESDGWVSKVLKNAKGGLRTVNMMEVLEGRVFAEELVEGMQKGEHHHGGHEAHHHHEHDEKAQRIFKGYFDDSEIQDRSLSDWAGEWKSVYPYLLDGSLDEVMEAKAEHGEKTAEEYREYYRNGYETDVEKIVIKGNKFYFYRNGKVLSSKYRYRGYKIYNYPKGNRGVRFFFEATDLKGGAPRFIQFSDHCISPAKSGHFHLYFGDESFEALSAQMEKWPTYYPADFDADDIVCDMLEHSGISKSHHHGHEHEHECEEHCDEHGEHDEIEYDEHVWLSLRNAVLIVEKISEAVQAIDVKNAAVYRQNSSRYAADLMALDTEYSRAVESAKVRTVLFADRFPFRYLASDYGLSYYAAFAGCSADSEASFETLAFLSKKVDELGLGTILTIEKSDGRLASTVKATTKRKNQKVLAMDSLQSVSKKEAAKGKTYLGTMRQNLEVLRQALN